MQSSDERFNRRHFVKWGAAGLAASTLPHSALSQNTTPEPELGERSAPANPITLRSTELALDLDPASGLPFEYRLLRKQARLRGEDSGQNATVTLCQRQPWAFATSTLTSTSHKATATQATFHFEAGFHAKHAASFDITYELKGSTVHITLANVTEQHGFELIEISMPRLVSVRESDDEPWLAHGDDGGSLAMLKEASAGKLAPNRFWGSTLGTLPIVMVGTAHAMCVQETTAYMDGTTLAVAGASGKRRAAMGTIKVHRINGSSCYDLNLPAGAPLNCGNEGTPNLLVGQPSTCRLDFLPVASETRKAWINAGKLVRDRMPAIPTHFYDDKYVYGIRCDEPLYPQPSATFEQCHQVIQRVSALIDNSPQVVHLWGWQFHGKDTGYPAVNVVNERIGGFDGMMHLMEQGAALNATITLSDNYDDAYRSSPAWSDDLIARRPDGQLWKSRPWTGEESYILGLAKYMDGPGPERIRYTCERYKLKHTTHVDVLSYYAIRNDWDSKHPASGIRNLVGGRYKVLKAFADHGVDVSSEALRYPMIGHISCFWYLTGPATCPFGGTAIPLVPLIYGKSAIWGLSGPRTRGDASVTRILERFFGACPHSILRADSDPAQFLDAFYLGVIPFFAMRGHAVEDFERDGDKTRIHLEGGVIIESDLAAKTIRITAGGADVLHDDAVFCPVTDAAGTVHKIACYSITARPLTVAIPAGWNPADTVAVVLYPDRRERAALSHDARAFTLNAEARRPVMLYRTAADAKLSS